MSMEHICIRNVYLTNQKEVIAFSTGASLINLIDVHSNSKEKNSINLTLKMVDLHSKHTAMFKLFRKHKEILVDVKVSDIDLDIVAGSLCIDRAEIVSYRAHKSNPRMRGSGKKLDRILNNAEVVGYDISATRVNSK